MMGKCYSNKTKLVKIPEVNIHVYMPKGEFLLRDSCVINQLNGIKQFRDVGGGFIPYIIATFETQRIWRLGGEKYVLTSTFADV